MSLSQPYVDLPTALLKADCEAVKKLPEDIQKMLRRVVELKQFLSLPGALD
jgi:hypothetical protein